MKDLLEKDFVAFHHIHSAIACDMTLCSAKEFDLYDDGDNYIKPYQQGNVSFINAAQSIKEIIPYEKFINECKKPSSFIQGRKKCDFLMNGVGDNSCFLFVEITSAYGKVENLSLPIENKKHTKVLYSGGKYEKCEDQLYNSLKDLISVPSINALFSTKRQKVCLMAYKVTSETELAIGIKRPQFFAKYLRAESKATAGENGALIASPKINSLGFEYRRISHEYSFKLV